MIHSLRYATPSTSLAELIKFDELMTPAMKLKNYKNENGENPWRAKSTDKIRSQKVD